MGMGAWDFFALIWNHPVISCLVLLLFTPALFPIVVYFSPLLISTALCAVALISMNMADSSGSSETEEDPYLRRWQSEHVEIDQSKPARQSWSQWATKVEEKTRVWVDNRFTKGKQVQEEQKFKWKVIHDNDYENEVSGSSGTPILPLAGKPTKIKYGTRTEDEDREADDAPNESLGGRMRLSTTEAEQEEEIQSASSMNVHPAAAASIIQQPKLNVISRAPESEEDVDTLTTKISVAALTKTEENRVSSGLHALAEAIQCTSTFPPNQKVGANSLDKSNSSTRSPSLKTRDEPEPTGDGSWNAPTISGEGLVQRVVPDNAGNATPSLESVGPVSTRGSPVASVQHGAALGSATTALGMSKSSSSRDTKSTASNVRSLPNNVVQPVAVAQLPVSDQVSSEKVRSSRSLSSKIVSVEDKVDSEPDASVGSESPEAGKAIRTSVSMLLSSMNERVAEARMMKPEPTAYNVAKSGDVVDMDTDLESLDAQESVSEESAAVEEKEGDQQIPRSGMSESEMGSTSIGEVHSGTKFSESGSRDLTEMSTEVKSSRSPTDSLDENEVGDRLADFEKVIFVDESSSLGNGTVSGQQRVAADGTTLCSEVGERKVSGSNTDGVLDVLESGQLLVSSDKKNKSKERLEDVCGSATVAESFIVARATINSNAADGIQFHKSILVTGATEERSERKVGSCGDDDIITQGDRAKQQHENPGSSTGSVDSKKSDKDLKREVENLCAVQTSEGRSSVVESLIAERQRHVSTTDQLQNIITGTRFSGPVMTSDLNPNLRSVVELEAGLEIVPHSSLSGTDEAISGKKSSLPELSQHLSRSLNMRGGTKGVWSSFSGDDESARDSTASRNAWVKANNEEYLSLKKSSSMPSSSRQDENSLQISILGKPSLAEKKQRDDDDSASDTEALVGIRKPWIRIHNTDSVEEITARLSKKYNPTWAKLPAREGAGTSRPSSALATIDEPKPIEPEIFAILSPKASRNSPTRKRLDSEKTDESADSYMSPMKKVLSAVRNVGNKDKDCSGKNGHPQTPERKGLSAVLNIKRPRFTSPLKRVLKSEAEGDKRPGSTNEKKEKVGTSMALALLEEEERGSTDKFKDRLITPLKKVFSTEASGGGCSGKKPDISQDLTPHVSPALFLASPPGQRQTPTRDEVAGDGKFRDRFILPLKKKFSSDSKEERKKGDSARAILHTPERSGPLTADETSGEVDMSNSDRMKSPDKKFSLPWTKKRAKDEKLAAPPQAQEEISPGSIFEKPRSPAISEKTTTRLISNDRSNCTATAAVVDEAGSSSANEFRSPDRNFFWPLSSQQDNKEKESSQSSKEKAAAGGKTSSSWWTRKRDKVVVEEATVAQAKQPTRDDARSSPERIIPGRSVDNKGVVDRITVGDIYLPAPSLLRWREKDEQQQPFSVRSRPNEDPARSTTHRREQSDTIPTRFRTHERRMSLAELSTPEKESVSPERTSVFDQSVSMPVRKSLFDKSNSVRKPQHSRQRSTDVMDLRSEAHLYKSRSATGAADQAQERCRNDMVHFSGSRSDPEVHKLYRNLDLPSTSNAEIRITDKLKVPLEEVLSLLAVGDSSTRNSTGARESSSSEETSSSEEEWSSSSDEDEAEPAAVPVQKLIHPVQSRKSHHFFNKGNRQLRNVDA